MSPNVGMAAAPVAGKDKTYIGWSDVACRDSASTSCYREVVCRIESQISAERNSAGDISSCLDNSRPQFGLQASFNDYSRYNLQPAKPSTVFVTIHGLWEASWQLDPTIDAYKPVLNGAEFNSIHLTLPGHRKSRRDPVYLESLTHNKPSASHEEWLSSVRETLLVARQLGDKTIIVGHSLGALLAVTAALEHPELVDHIVLIEPALRVNSVLDSGSCMIGKIPESMTHLAASLLGQQIPDGISLEMGCEVQKVADRIFQRHSPDRLKDPQAPLRPVHEMLVYRDVASRIKVPVLLINNDTDFVVSVEANRYFYSGLKGPKMYFALNQVRRLSHGAIPRAPDLVADVIAEAIYWHLPESPFGRYHLMRVQAMLMSPEIWTCDDIHSPCKSYALIRLMRLERLNKVVCDLLGTEEDCRKANLALQLFEQHGKAILEFAKTNGLAATIQRLEAAKASSPSGLPHHMKQSDDLRDLAKKIKTLH